jgi:hypothetical protein
MASDRGPSAIPLSEPHLPSSAALVLDAGAQAGQEQESAPLADRPPLPRAAARTLAGTADKLAGVVVLNGDALADVQNLVRSRW